MAASITLAVSPSAAFAEFLADGGPRHIGLSRERGAVDLNLWQIFTNVARELPERDAIVWRGRTRSYGELLERTVRLANVLTKHDLGLHQERRDLHPWESGQDLVGLYLLNSPEYLEATLAGYGARVAPFNVNYRYVSDELAYLLNDAGASAVIYHSRFAPQLAEVLPRLDRQPLLLQVDDGTDHELLPGALDYEAALADASGELEANGHDADDLYVLYTGGTTGLPKGTLWRQADIWNAALGGVLLGEETGLHTLADLAASGAASGGRCMPIAPFMHGAAHWLGLKGVLCGGTIVVNDVVDRLDPAEVWTTAARERVESTLMVGEAFARPLLDELEAGEYDVSSLTAVVVGGAITTPETKARLLAALPHTRVLDTAGASETDGGLSSVSTAGAVAEAGVFAGTPFIKVLSGDRSRLLTPGDEEIGWYAKCGRIPLGYLGDPDKTNATFPVVDGVRYSVPGDRARLRADGMVELLGRDSVTINSGGEKIFAEEVEQALIVHPDVRDAVVVGRPSERWGSEVVAVVQLRDGADPSDDDLLKVAGTRIARYKLPKAIIRVDAVVRSPAGKPDYRWAADLSAARKNSAS